MAMCLYPAFIGAGDACEQLGLCKVKSVLGDWTCDDCTDIMTRVANFMQEPSTIEQGVAVLTVRFSYNAMLCGCTLGVICLSLISKGDCFCGAEGHTAECPDLVNSLAEPCMQVDNSNKSMSLLKMRPTITILLIFIAMQVLSAVLMETTPELCQDIVGVC